MEHSGMLQYIPSSTLADILSENNGSIQNYLKQHNPSEDEDCYGINPNTLENYVKSCGNNQLFSENESGLLHNYLFAGSGRPSFRKPFVNFNR